MAILPLLGFVQGYYKAIHWAFSFVLCLNILCLDKHKELGFILKRSRSRRYPAIHITDAHYADDIALFIDKTSDAEKPLHLLEAAW